MSDAPILTKENSICGKCGYEMSAHDVAWGSATCPPGKAVVDRGRLPRYFLTIDANGQPVMHASPRGPWVAWTDLHRAIGDEPSWVGPVPSPAEPRGDVDRLVEIVRVARHEGWYEDHKGWWEVDDILTRLPENREVPRD